MNNNVIFRRFLAIATDSVIITYALIFLFFGLNKPLSQFYQTITENKEFDLNFQLIRILIFFIYCTLFEASKFQGTFGKKIFGIEVVDEQEHKISFAKSLIRNSGKILSAIPLFLGFIWAAFSQNQQAWHDKIAKTYVIKHNKAGEPDGKKLGGFR